MVTIEPKEERVRRAYLAFANRNWAIVSSLLADDVVWHEEGKDDLRGKAEVIRYLERELRPKTVVSELLEVSTVGDRVRGVDRSKMAGLPDREEEHRCVDYFRFDDQSNIAEIWYCAEQLPAAG